MRFIDLTGVILHGVEVIKDERGQGKNPRLECRCHCGVMFSPIKDRFRRGQVRSCGCQRCDASRHTKHQLYGIWKGMKERCYSANSQAFHNYGGRGIRVCSRWLHSFESFCSDMGERPTPKHSIDRIDNNGDYEPSNCRWADLPTQINNSRIVRKVKAAGEELSLSQWARRLGVSRERARKLHDEGRLVSRINKSDTGIMKVFHVTVTAEELITLRSVDKNDWARRTLLRAAAEAVDIEARELL